MTDLLRPQPELRAAYRAFAAITTRWADNDVYGHVNNVVYYAWFDTAINGHLISQGALDIQPGAAISSPISSPIGLVVETQCHYFSPISFPQNVTAGIRVAHVGKGSVRYEVGLFADDEALCAAKGHFVHVYVDRANRRPVALPPSLSGVVQALVA